MSHTRTENKQTAISARGIVTEAGREEDQRIAGEDQLSKKQVEAGMN
jgi:hypothetical protein